jgi:hypothetical protein
MRIGLDFDNTIVCYDQAIALLSDGFFDLPNEVPRTKLGVRDYLRSEDRETEWTAFQGQLYGPGMCHAKPFEGAVGTMQQLVSEGYELTIVSHRSRYPYAGPRYDLHNAARNWIIRELHPNGIFDRPTQPVYFLETFSEKLAQISDSGFDVFLDDLSTVLESTAFPESTLGILFNPASRYCKHETSNQISSWPSLLDLIKEIS